MRRSKVRGLYVFSALFSLWDGDGVRDALGWWGFTAVSLLLLIGGIRLLRLEWAAAAAAVKTGTLIPVGVFMAVCALSTLWSAYRLVTVLTVVIQLATVVVAGALLVAVPVRRLILIGALMLHVHLLLALLFELGVAMSPAGRLLPLFTDYAPNVPDPYYWSQGMLLHGGRIQGIAGNPNTTGFIALLALIVLTVSWRSGILRLVPTAVAAVLDGSVLLLTRSATVTFSAAAVVVVAGIVLVCRRVAPVVLLTAAPLLLVAVWAASSSSAGPVLRALGRGDGFTGRSEIWRTVGTLIRQRPGLGWGWTGWWAPWVQPYDRLVIRDGVQYLQAHNAFLDVLLQLGIPGLITFAMLIGSVTWKAVRLALTSGAWSLLPLLLLVAVLTRAVAESRLLIEGDWALLVQLSFAVPTAATTRAKVPREDPGTAARPESAGAPPRLPVSAIRWSRTGMQARPPRGSRQ